jgi:hypothetical protein
MIHIRFYICLKIIELLIIILNKYLKSRKIVNNSQIIYPIFFFDFFDIF